MAAGLEVINSSGIIQVTSDYKNLQYVGKGAVSFSNSLQTSLVGNVGEVIAFRVDDSSKWGITPPRIYSGMGSTSFVCAGGGSATITYYRFKFADIAAGNYFEVYNAAGERCFSDAARFMKVLGFVQGTDSASSATFSHGAGITAAVIASKISTYYNPYGSTAYYAHQLFNFSSGLVTALDRPVYNSPIIPSRYSYKAYSFLVIDVSGL